MKAIKISNEYKNLVNFTPATELEDAVINLNFALDGYHVQIAPYLKEPFIACRLIENPLSLITLGAYKNVNDAILQCRIACCRELVNAEFNEN